MTIAGIALMAVPAIAAAILVEWLRRRLRSIGGADLGHPVTPGDENALLGRKIDD